MEEFITKYDAMIADVKDVVNECLKISREKREIEITVEGAYLLLRIHDFAGANLWIQRQKYDLHEITISILDTTNVYESTATVEFNDRKGTNQPFDMMGIIGKNKEQILKIIGAKK